MKALVINKQDLKHNIKRIKEIVKTTKCKVKINERKGLPFILHRYRKRKIFLIMIILVCFSIFVTSNYIWNIEIVGLNQISSEEIIYVCKETILRG